MGVLAQSATAKCTTIPTTKIATGTHRKPYMGRRAGSLNTQSQRAQSTKAMSTRLPPISGITAVRKALPPVANHSVVVDPRGRRQPDEHHDVRDEDADGHGHGRCDPPRRGRLGRGWVRSAGGHGDSDPRGVSTPIGGENSPTILILLAIHALIADNPVVVDRVALIRASRGPRDRRPEPPHADTQPYTVHGTVSRHRRELGAFGAGIAAPRRGRHQTWGLQFTRQGSPRARRCRGGAGAPEPADRGQRSGGVPERGHGHG